MQAEPATPAPVYLNTLSQTFDGASPEAFGSRQSGFIRGQEILRLTYDGRDGLLTLESAVPWRDLAMVRTSHRHASPPEVEVLLEALPK